MVAGSFVCLTKFKESLPIFDHIASGIRKLLDDSHPQYLMNEFFQGQALEQMKSLDQASALYEDIREKWVPKVGPVSPLGLMAQAALGSVQRKQGKHDLAEDNLFEAYRGRKQLFSIDNNVCLDSAVQLALEYREIGEFAMAIELLDSVSNSRVYQEDFERYCQTQHIRALVKLDTDDYEPAKRMLMTLLNQVSGKERNKNNRELLWARCTLADALRQGGEGDDAPLLFDGLVEFVDLTQPPSPDESGTEYLETPKQLDIAETAIRLVREAKQTEAAQLLEENNLKWVREKDFWILGQGGPFPDTATIRPVDVKKTLVTSQTIG
jgi:tetratricopeptide (TPR) repeat protein